MSQTPASGGNAIIIRPHHHYCLCTSFLIYLFLNVCSTKNSTKGKRVLISVSLAVLLGLSWTLGYFVLVTSGPAHLVLSIIFCLCTTTQVCLLHPLFEVWTAGLVDIYLLLSNFLLFVFSGTSDIHPLYCQNHVLQSLGVPGWSGHFVCHTHVNIPSVEEDVERQLWVLQRPYWQAVWHHESWQSQVCPLKASCWVRTRSSLGSTE